MLAMVSRNAHDCSAIVLCAANLSLDQIEKALSDRFRCSLIIGRHHHPDERCISKYWTRGITVFVCCVVSLHSERRTRGMSVAKSLPVHPVPARRLRNADPTAAALPDYYCLAPCRPLPAFDPIPSVKRVLFSRAVVKSYDVCFRSTRVLLIPLYCIGLVLRLASFFVSEPAINPLAVTAAACLTPLCFIAFLDMRTELILVLLKSFDFWFLSATSLLWMASLGAAMGFSMRLAVLPALWMEMIVGILTESFVIVRSGFSVVSVSVLVSILTLMTGVSLNLTSGLDYYETIFTIAPTHFVLSLRDVILNTMGTMAIFYARLMFFSIRGIHKRRRDPTNTRVQSNLVRCMLRWEEGRTLKSNEQHLRSRSSSRMLFRLRSRIEPHNNTNAPSTAATIARQPRLLQMTPIVNPDFEALVTNDTICPKALPVARRFPRGLRLVMRAVGAIGLVGTVIGFVSRFDPPDHQSKQPLSSADGLDVVSAVALAATTTYASVFFACCQRKLLRFVVTTFNFIFLSAQLSVAHICVCDVFYWQTRKMISVVSSWLWIHVLLTADALTPAMKSHLGFKVWHLLPVIVLAIAGQVALAVDLVWTSRWSLQERVVWSVNVHRDQRVDFHSSSVLLGRLATLVVWFLRLLRRVCCRSSDDELILLQGGVEFDYISWKRLATQAPRATGVASTQRY